jgi:hypothetical protein
MIPGIPGKRIMFSCFIEDDMFIFQVRIVLNNKEIQAIDQIEIILS